METADFRAKRSLLTVRMSLRRFKRSPSYRALLEGVLSQRETADMSSLERRRLRLDRVAAGLELEKIKRGEKLSEFAGLMSLGDALRDYDSDAEAA